MSHNYYFHCLDCHSTGEMENQRLEAVRELCRDVKELGVAARALLKAAERTRTRARRRGGTRTSADGARQHRPYLVLTVLQDPLPLTWLAEHGDHNVRAISDYGALDGDCYRYVTCGTCEQAHPCRRPTDHEGACSPRGEAPADTTRAT